jgi:sugar/nucleoside kinase (ribokinase family)
MAAATALRRGAGARDVLCTGLAFCDLLFVGLESIPRPGTESRCRDFEIKAGGAANTPMALARLGVDALFASAVGDDEAGRLARSFMVASGMDLSALASLPGCRTSVSAVLSLSGERSFASFFADKAWEAMERQVRLFAPGCGRIHGYVADCLNTDLVMIAKGLGIPLSIDCGWDGEISLGDLRFILEACDLFLANDAEAAHLTGKDDPAEALELIKESCAGRVVVKLGERGALMSGDEIGDAPIRIAAAKAPSVVDPTGAGDLFAAGFLAGRCWGWDDRDSARLAAASGALAVGFPGGMDASYSKQAVLGLFEAGEAAL